MEYNYVPGIYEELTGQSAGTITFNVDQYFVLDGSFKFTLSDITVYADGVEVAPSAYDLAPDVKYTDVESTRSGKTLYSQIKFIDAQYDGQEMTVDANNFGSYTDNEAVQSLAAGNFDTKTVHVSTNGNDATGDGTAKLPYKTITHALSKVTDASIGNRYEVLVAPGNYNEPGTLVMKEYCNVTGAAPNSTVVSASSVTGTGNGIFTHISNSIISNLGITPDASTVGIRVETAGIMVVEDVAIFSGFYGILIDHDDAALTVNGLVGVGQSAVLIFNGAGTLNFSDVRIASIGNYQKGLDISGATAICYGHGYTDNSNSSSSSIYVAVGGVAEIKDVRVSGANRGIEVRDSLTAFSGVQLSGCTTGVECPSGDAICSLNSFSAVLGTMDFDIQSPTARFAIAGLYDSDKAYFNPNAVVVAALLDQKASDEGLNILGELHVGDASKGAEICGGEGDSFTKGMLVYTWDGSAFVDVTPIASSPTDSTFAYPNVNIGTAVYVSADVEDKDALVKKFFGLKAKIETAHDGVGEIVTEYWDGGAWVEVGNSNFDANPSYLPFANNVFENVGDVNTRLDLYLKTKTWVAHDPMGYGKNLPWTRYYIKAALDVAPVLQQLKVHANSTEMNADGWIEYRGSGRPLGDLRLNLSNGKPFEGNMQSQNLWVSDDIGVGYTNNKFTATGDKLGFASFLPYDLDTSSPIRLVWSYRPDTTATLVFTVRWAWVSEADADLYYTSNPAAIPNSRSTTVSKDVVLGAVTRSVAFLDIKEMFSRRDAAEGDELWISIQPTTMSGSVSLGPGKADYVKWCEGGHI